MTYSFADGQDRPVPGAYIEFAERLVLPEHRHLPVRRRRGCCGTGSGGGGSSGGPRGCAWWAGEALRAPRPQADAVQEHHRRDGFEAQNADKIFESTTLAQQGQ